MLLRPLRLTLPRLLRLTLLRPLRLTLLLRLPRLKRRSNPSSASMKKAGASRLFSFVLQSSQDRFASPQRSPRQALPGHLLRRSARGNLSHALLDGLDQRRIRRQQFQQPLP
ncbi:hypothetical protein, partial [Methyloversatilis discipulorum]|uniref:hypothetical protein n=1 Tax=Methyloversatilis discipulorum TaxID=1119528 RepID=UPI003AF4D47C